MKGCIVLAVMSMVLDTLALAAEFQVGVRLTVQRGCQFGQRHSVGVEQLGLVDFGITSRLDNPEGPLSAQLQSTRVLHLECNPDTPYQIQVDGGQHGGVGDVRYLANTTEHAQSIPYRLYQDAARHSPLSVNVPLSGRVANSGTVDLPLYARIDRLAEIPRVGRYSDVLRVTVSW